MGRRSFLKTSSDGVDFQLCGVILAVIDPRDVIAKVRTHRTRCAAGQRASAAGSFFSSALRSGSRSRLSPPPPPLPRPASPNGWPSESVKPPPARRTAPHRFNLPKSRCSLTRRKSRWLEQQHRERAGEAPIGLYDDGGSEAAGRGRDEPQRSRSRTLEPQGVSATARPSISRSNALMSGERPLGSGPCRGTRRWQGLMSRYADFGRCFCRGTLTLAGLHVRVRSICATWNSSVRT